MGILDDAIREHLELIRRRGAADSEVQRLEDEAFGPPTRPDEADFPESEEAQAVSGNGVATEAAVPGSEEPGAHEDVTTLLPTGESGGAVAEERVEEPGTGEQLAEEDVEPAAEAVPAEARAEESEEPSLPPEEGTVLYDQTRDELDVDLGPAPQLEDEEEAAEPPSGEHPADEPEAATPLEPPIESLDTVEHPFPDEISEPAAPHEAEEPSDEYAVADEGAAPEHDEEVGEEEDEDEGGEDVLADTPEFLKDAPEDDELWFEQGEPKDFDF